MENLFLVWIGRYGRRIRTERKISECTADTTKWVNDSEKYAASRLRAQPEAIAHHSLYPYRLPRVLLLCNAVLFLSCEVSLTIIGSYCVQECDMQATWPQHAIHRCSMFIFSLSCRANSFVIFLLCHSMRVATVVQICTTNAAPNRVNATARHPTHKANLEFYVFVAVVARLRRLFFFIWAACRVPTLSSYFHHTFLLRILLLHTMRSTKIVVSVLYSQLKRRDRVCVCLSFARFSYLMKNCIIIFLFLQLIFSPRSLSWDDHNCSKKNRRRRCRHQQHCHRCRINSLSGGDSFTRRRRIDAHTSVNCNCGIANRLDVRCDQLRALRELLNVILSAVRLLVFCWSGVPTNTKCNARALRFNSDGTVSEHDLRLVRV